MSNKPERILYVTDTPSQILPYVDELQDNGFDVHVVGQDDDLRKVAVDAAISLIRDPEQKFDLVITEMLMACGLDENLSIEQTNKGWTTGREFIRLMREEEHDVPFLVHELHTGLVYCKEYMRPEGLSLGNSGEVVPVLQKAGSPESLVRTVNDILDRQTPSVRQDRHASLDC